MFNWQLLALLFLTKKCATQSFHQKFVMCSSSWKRQRSLLHRPAALTTVKSKLSQVTRPTHTSVTTCRSSESYVEPPSRPRAHGDLWQSLAHYWLFSGTTVTGHFMHASQSGLSSRAMKLLPYATLPSPLLRVSLPLMPRQAVDGCAFVGEGAPVFVGKDRRLPSPCVHLCVLLCNTYCLCIPM